MQVDLIEALNKILPSGYVATEEDGKAVIRQVRCSECREQRVEFIFNESQAMRAIEAAMWLRGSLKFRAKAA
ncbi:MAG: hypothetical protein WC773_02075 [Patescibacteria group bacterium]|jgi:hypothetical protein